MDKVCSVTHCMKFVGGKWKPIILHRVKNGVNRFGVLRAAIPGITKQMLTQQLRQLEEDGFLKRKIYPEIPPRVEYSLTKQGKSLLPIVAAMEAWGDLALVEPEEDVKDKDQFRLDL